MTTDDHLAQSSTQLQSRQHHHQLQLARLLFRQHHCITSSLLSLNRKRKPRHFGGVKLSTIECLSALPLWLLLIAVAVRAATLLLVGLNVGVLTTRRIFLLLPLFVLALLSLALRALTLARLSLISFVTHV
jgi:hypothetical protein